MGTVAPASGAGASSQAGLAALRTGARLAGMLPHQAPTGILCGQSEPLRLNAEIVPLHDFAMSGAPVTAWRVAIFGEHISPDGWRGPRRESREDAERDLADLIGVRA